MNAIEHIRRNVFKVTQTAFSGFAGTTQASVSRWENNEQEPGLEEMARIREKASEMGIHWDDRWFFETPAPAEQAAS
jgi:transcriptional regulator with XRE-family HTH domain